MRCRNALQMLRMLTAVVALTSCVGCGLLQPAPVAPTPGPAPTPVPIEPANFSPLALFSISHGQPIVGEPLTFDASRSEDPDGTIVSYAWDLGPVTASGAVVGYVYADPGTYTIRLTVTDNDGAVSVNEHPLTVTAPSSGCGSGSGGSTCR